MSGAVKMPRRLYLTADGSRVVEDGDPEAATLLCAAGGEVPHAVAVRHGLLDTPPPESDEQPEPDEAESKARRPAANKARTRTGDK